MDMVFHISIICRIIICVFLRSHGSIICVLLSWLRRRLNISIIIIIRPRRRLRIILLRISIPLHTRIRSMRFPRPRSVIMFLLLCRLLRIRRFRSPGISSISMMYHRIHHISISSSIIILRRRIVIRPLPIILRI